MKWHLRNSGIVIFKRVGEATCGFAVERMEFDRDDLLRLAEEIRLSPARAAEYLETLSHRFPPPKR